MGFQPEEEAEASPRNEDTLHYLLVLLVSIHGLEGSESSYHHCRPVITPMRRGTRVTYAGSSGALGGI